MRLIATLAALLAIVCSPTVVGAAETDSVTADVIEESEDRPPSQESEDSGGDGGGGDGGPSGTGGASLSAEELAQQQLDRCAAEHDAAGAAGTFLTCGTLGALPGGPAVPQIDPARLAQMARDLVPVRIPSPNTSPDDVAQITGVETFFWLDPDGWRPVTARAEVGAVWAEVTARPVRAEWSPGDGSPAVVCRGPGHPWSPDRTTTTCGHTYADVGARTVVVAVTYAVTWTSSTGASGTQAPIVLDTSFDLTIEERQVVLD